MNTLEFEPVNRFWSAGNEIQRCKTIHNGIEILWETYFPFNIFKSPIDTFTPDIILPMSTKVINGVLNDAYYTDEGYGMVDFKTLEDAIQFINDFKSGIYGI